MRALAVLPSLLKRHEVLVLAGGDAYDAMWPDYSIQRIPTLHFYHNAAGQISYFRTMTRNVSAMLDLHLRGAGLDMVERILRDFAPDVVVSDSEPYILRAAERLGIPRISFDHFGIIAYCEPKLSWSDRLKARGQTWVYHMLYGHPERVIVSAFFDAPARRDGVVVVGPVIRPEARQATVSRGEHLLVYISRGEEQYSPRMEQMLLQVGCPVRIYGTPRRGMQGNLQWKPFNNLGFIEDLASCRAIFATTGNQLLGEVCYFGKPILGMPMSCLEQRLNAEQLERLGIGHKVSKRGLNAEVIRTFLAWADGFTPDADRTLLKGEQAAIQAIERFAVELTEVQTAGPAAVRTSA